MNGSDAGSGEAADTEQDPLPLSKTLEDVDTLFQKGCNALKEDVNTLFQKGYSVDAVYFLSRAPEIRKCNDLFDMTVHEVWCINDTTFKRVIEKTSTERLSQAFCMQ